MKKVIKIFTEIVKELNKNQIYPIIYGSLGFYLKLGEEGEINDIDFIINQPKQFSTCKKILLKKGFVIDPDHKRELIKNNFFVSFLDKKDIEKLIGEPLKLTAEFLNGSYFFNVDITQYYKIYTRGLRNKYRKERKEKEDLEKIKEIEKVIKKERN